MQRYDLTPDEVSVFVTDLLSSHPPDQKSEFCCYFICGDNCYSNVARYIESSVFREFFGNDFSQMSEAYSCYESASWFFLAIDPLYKRPVGALRIIENSPGGFKTLNDIKQEPLQLPIEVVREFHSISDLDKCWDVGTVAIMSDYRGSNTHNVLSTTLYGLFYAEIRKRSIEHVVTILDDHAYRQLTELFGIPFDRICGSEPFSYLGSEKSHAAHMFVPGVYSICEAFMNNLDSSLRDLLDPHLRRMLYSEGLPNLIEVH